MGQLTQALLTWRCSERGGVTEYAGWLHRPVQLVGRWECADTTRMVNVERTAKLLRFTECYSALEAVGLVSTIYASGPLPIWQRRW